MKRILFAMALAAVSVAFGAANDMLVSFSTPGIDRYADGSRVRSGESYALVWTKNGETFGGLSVDCQPVKETDALVMVAPLAKRGRCPVTVVEIDTFDATNKYAGGTFSVYLLDTRVKGADGKVKLASYVDGLPQLVNSFGMADASGDIKPSTGVSGNLVGVTPVELGEVGVYTEIGSPTITAMRIDGANIRLEVKDMSDAADYFVVEGDTPGNFAPAMNVTPVKGGFEFKKPRSGGDGDGAKLYKVIGVRKFGAGQ